MVDLIECCHFWLPHWKGLFLRHKFYFLSRAIRWLQVDWNLVSQFLFILLIRIIDNSFDSTFIRNSNDTKLTRLLIHLTKKQAIERAMARYESPLLYHLLLYQMEINPGKFGIIRSLEDGESNDMSFVLIKLFNHFG